MKKNSTAGETIKMLLEMRGMTSKQLCGKLGISEQVLSQSLKRDMKLEKFLLILETLEYDFVIVPTNGMGTLRIRDDLQE